VVYNGTRFDQGPYPPSAAADRRDGNPAGTPPSGGSAALPSAAADAKNGSPVLGLFARRCPEKGLDLMLDAMFCGGNTGD
jgi:hypothetical protein